MPICKNEFMAYPFTINAHLSADILCPFGTGRQFSHVKYELGLHMAVKLYWNALRFARVIREKLVLSNYILHCHAYA